MPAIYGKDYGYFCPRCDTLMPYTKQAKEIRCMNKECGGYGLTLDEMGSDVMSQLRMSEPPYTFSKKGDG